jgi:hypothetical protein
MMCIIVWLGKTEHITVRDNNDNYVPLRQSNTVYIIVRGSSVNVIVRQGNTNYIIVREGYTVLSYNRKYSVYHCNAVEK